MNHEEFVLVASEDDRTEMATLEDFTLEELEDRLELCHLHCYRHLDHYDCYPHNC